MKKQIHEKIKAQIRSTFNCREIESLVISFFDYQAQKRNYKFGELTLLHFEMFNGKNEEIISVAAAIEMLALATDILDDLQDQDNLDTPWQKADGKITLNLATGLLFLSKKTLDQSEFANHTIINESYYFLIFQSMVGQHFDLKNDSNTDKDYLNLVMKKSSSLITLACLLGAMIAQSNQQQQSIVKQYAEKMGLISQLKNDLNDLYTWDKKSDLRQKKRTFPILYMLSINEPSKVKEYYLSENSFENIKDQRQEFIEEMEQFGAMNYTKAMIELNKIETFDLIDQLDISDKYKERLKTFI